MAAHCFSPQSWEAPSQRAAAARRGGTESLARMKAWSMKSKCSTSCVYYSISWEQEDEIIRQTAERARKLKKQEKSVNMTFSKIHWKESTSLISLGGFHCLRTIWRSLRDVSVIVMLWLNLWTEDNILKKRHLSGPRQCYIIYIYILTKLFRITINIYIILCVTGRPSFSPKARRATKTAKVKATRSKQEPPLGMSPITIWRLGRTCHQAGSELGQQSSN